MSRKFTIYLRDDGIDLLKKLFEKGHYSFEDFFMWFEVSGVSKEQKSVFVRVMIQRLHDEGVIQRENNEDTFYLTRNAQNKVVELVNLGKIRKRLH